MVASLNVIDNRPEKHGARSFNPNSCNPNAKCGNGLEKVYPTCAVRYGFMAYIGEFKYAPGTVFGCGAKVVVQTMRGIEIGEQVSLTCTGCDKSIKRDKMLDYVKNSGPDFYKLKSGRILREANEQDLEEERRLNEGAKEKMQRARAVAREMGLQMKFVACEHLFGGERIIFHFMSDGRVDFREFVRTLAHEYHTRIEMHQVGARDEARLVADFEICGRECCCKNFLKTLRPVTMRMAKMQKATLDPSKVSGRCGRLRCCLRYEHEGYEELDKKLPRIGNRVRTDQGTGTVKDRQILTQLVTVQYDSDGRVETVGVEDLTERNLPPRNPTEITQPEQPTRRETQRGGQRAEQRRDGGRGSRPPHQEMPTADEPVMGGSEGFVFDDSGPMTSDDSSAGQEPTNAGPPPTGDAGSQERRRRGRRRGRRGRRGRPQEPGQGSSGQSEGSSNNIHDDFGANGGPESGGNDAGGDP